ncbi:unknown [Acetobacter sp. CAG:977]|nr:unknown [Acetobacter sp. CAG:977]
MSVVQSDGIKKTDTAALKRDLEEIGVCEDGAAHYASLFALDVPFDFVFTPRNREYFKNGEIAGEAFERLLPEINGRRFSSFFVEDIGHRMKCPDFIAGKSVSFQTDSLTVRWSKVPEENLSGFLDMVGKTGATRLNLRQTKLILKDDAFVCFLNDKKIESLTYSVSDDGMDGFLEKLGETKLKKFDMSYSDAREKGLSLAFSRLPPTLEALGTECNIIGEGAVLDALCTGIRPLRLKELNLQCCSLTNTSLEKLIEAFPPELESLNIGNNTNITDKSGNLLLKRLKRPDCIIRKLDIDGMFGMSKGLQKELREAAQDNDDRYMQKLQCQKAEQIAKTKEGLRIKNAVKNASKENIKSLLHDALEYGAADAAFDKMRETGAVLTLKDALATNKDGKTLLEACRDMGKLPQLMAPEMFGNVKDFKEVFDALSEKDKRLYDGKDGRPTLQQAKNKIMAEAVRRSLGRPSGKGR